MTDSEDQTIALPPDRILRLLSEGKVEVEGLIPWSSNATLLVTVYDAEHSTLAIYKPQRGERPLWDFPHGTLGRREVAAYVLSEALSWGLVPPTILRHGPHGLGSLQLYIRAPDDAHFFTIQHQPEFVADLQRVAAFDVIANNADRKAGHCLVGYDQRLWAIDNALTFHEEPKLRTVIWDFAGQTLPREIARDVRKLQAELAGATDLTRALERLLSRIELMALRRRVQQLVDDGCFPEPGPGRVVPWPLV